MFLLGIAQVYNIGGTGEHETVKKLNNELAGWNVGPRLMRSGLKKIGRISCASANLLPCPVANCFCDFQELHSIFNLNLSAAYSIKCKQFEHFSPTQAAGRLIPLGVLRHAC